MSLYDIIFLVQMLSTAGAHVCVQRCVHAKRQSHSRLGAKSPVRHLDDIALDLILREIRNQLKSIALSMRYADD